VAEIPLRFRWLRRVGAVSAAVGLLGGLVMVIVGIALLWKPDDRPMWITTGPSLLRGGVLLDVLTQLVYGILVLTLKIEGTTNRLHSTLLDLDERVAAMAGPLKEIAENSHISDAAKSIAHRARERDALRDAIREDMLPQDWEAAYYLIAQMEHRFGYRQEAQKIRREVDTSRQETIERMLVEAVHHIEQLCDQRNWDQARAAADRLLRLFPKHEQTRNLTDLLDRKRDEYKAALLRAYREASDRNESERCVAILKELDPFLTRSEADALAESARGVFRAQLMNLGVQFSLAVTEKRWRDALEVGLQITSEFPNSQMAQEVREKLDVLQKRAGFTPDKAAEVIEHKTPAAK